MKRTAEVSDALGVVAGDAIYGFPSCNLPVVPCTYRRVRSVGMRTWTFRGALEEGQCKMRFRMKGSKRDGIAVLDTGYPAVLLSRRFATDSGVTLIHDGREQVAGIGQPLREVPRARAEFQFLSPDDGALNLGGLVAVEDLPMDHDLLVGTSILCLGVFTLTGPSGKWDWYVREENLPKFQPAPRT